MFVDAQPPGHARRARIGKRRLATRPCDMDKVHLTHREFVAVAEIEQCHYHHQSMMVLPQFYCPLPAEVVLDVDDSCKRRGFQSKRTLDATHVSVKTASIMALLAE